MPSSKKMLTVSILLLVTTFHNLLSHTGQCVGVPSRFFYEHKRSVGAANPTEEETAKKDTDANADADAEPKVKLIGEQQENDPIPLDFYRELDNISDISEFIEHFVNKESIDPKLGIQDNFRRSVERAAAVIPKAANCMPENTVVPLTPLNPSKDPKIIYYPKCTRVKRCGGCCGSDLMSCQPVESEFINFEVTKYFYGDQAPIRGKEIIVVEQHNRCKCGCRIKEGDCNSYQIYRPELCRCMCTNDDALQKCLAKEHKYWDDTTCRCVCRDSQSCTTGTIFDENQCKCIDINHLEFFE